MRSSRRLPFILAAAFLGLLLASSAQARIGNPIKKAKEKLQKATEQNAAPQSPAAQAPEFDDVTVELTNTRIEGIVRSLDKASEAMAGREAVVEKLNRALDEKGKHLEKNGDAIRALQNKRDELITCYHDGYRAATDRKAEEYSKRALTDPALREKFSRAAQEDNAAAARGDSAAIQRLQKTLTSEILPTSEDSAKVRQSCGPMPPPTPAEVKLKQLDAQCADYEEQIRAIDKKVADAQQGELNPQQWGIALERIRAYLAWKQSGSKSAPPFTQQEIDALEKHREKLQAAVK